MDLRAIRHGRRELSDGLAEGVEDQRVSIRRLDPQVVEFGGQSDKVAPQRSWHAGWVQNVVRQFGPYL